MTDWVIRLIEYGGYPAVFLLMLLETIFPPIPSEVILPLAGIEAAKGTLSLSGVIASGTAGAMVGNFFWYLVARAIGRVRLTAFITRYGRWLTLDLYDVERVQRLFGRFGAGIVLVGRMLPTIRTFVSVPAGLADMNLVKFLIWSTLGTAVWSAALAAAGFVLGREFHQIDKVAGPLSSAIIASIVLWYIWRQLTWHRRRVRPVDAPSDTHP
jgi:membrane protein DedA with SNARE-associated domain